MLLSIGLLSESWDIQGTRNVIDRKELGLWKQCRVIGSLDPPLKGYVVLLLLLLLLFCCCFVVV
jgi:hypothetical protein